MQYGKETRNTPLTICLLLNASLLLPLKVSRMRNHHLKKPPDREDSIKASGRNMRAVMLNRTT
jgi:hypothetical protein